MRLTKGADLRLFKESIHTSRILYCHLKKKSSRTKIHIIQSVFLAIQLATSLVCLKYIPSNKISIFRYIMYDSLAEEGDRMPARKTKLQKM